MNTKNWNPVSHYKNIDVAERYDDERFSRFSGRVFNKLEKLYVSKAFEHVAKGSRVLDLPCGTGRLAEVLLDDGFEVVGVDISAEMLAVARRRLARYKGQFISQIGDAREIGKTETRYDAALCARVLMHFPLQEQIEFLRGVAEATTGDVIFTQSLSTPYQRFRRGLKRLIGNAAPANYPITEDELAALLKGAGLKEVRRLRPAALISEEIIVIARRI